MPEPIGFAVVRTSRLTGKRTVVWHWDADAPPYTPGESWRKFKPDTDEHTFALHAIEGEPVEEVVGA